jgi:hypothetical protein
VGHIRAHTPQPEHIPDSTRHASAGLGRDMAPVGHTRRAGQPGALSQRAASMVATFMDTFRSSRVGPLMANIPYGVCKHHARAKGTPRSGAIFGPTEATSKGPA